MLFVLHGGDFGEPSGESRLRAEPGRQERLDQLPSQHFPHNAASEANHVHVVVLDALVGRVGVADQGRTDAVYLVRGHTGPHAAPADRNAAIYLAARNGLGQGDHEIGIIVIGRQAVGAEIDHLVACVAQPRADLLFQRRSRRDLRQCRRASAFSLPLALALSMTNHYRAIVVRSGWRARGHCRSGILPLHADARGIIPLPERRGRMPRLRPHQASAERIVCSAGLSGVENGKPARGRVMSCGLGRFSYPSDLMTSNTSLHVGNIRPLRRL